MKDTTSCALTKKNKPTTGPLIAESTIYLTIASLMIAPELEWRKEYELRGSDHFPIIIEVDREIYMKQQ